MNNSSTLTGLSVVLICLNEEKNIERALRSVAFADEVVVYDSGSTDRTCDIAQNLGAKVHRGPWLGFGSTKLKATSLAANDWILSLDADEEVSNELAQELRAKFQSLQPDKIYSLSRLSRYLNHWVRYGGWFPDRQNRLFNRKHSNWNTSNIHEKVLPLEISKLDGDADQLKSALQKAVVNLDSVLFHYVFKDIDHQVSTNNKYSTLQALEMFKKGRKFSWFHYFTKPYVKFVECYFLKLGVLDGWVGYLIARNAAYSVLLKWSKLHQYELNRKFSDNEQPNQARP